MTQAELTLVDLCGFEAIGEIPLPFNLNIGTFVNGGLECLEVFRFLPNKRLVCRARYQGMNVVVKLFFGAGSKRRAKREFDGVQLVKNAKLSTPKVLHFIEDETASFSVIIFEYIDQAKTLGQCLGEAQTPDDRMAVFEQAILFIAHMHEASIYQQDVHLDNFLYGQNNLYLIDGDQVKTKRGSKCLESELAINNLAMFFTQLHPWEDEHAGDLLVIYLKVRKGVREIGLPSVLKQLGIYRDWREKKYIEKKVFRQCSAFDVIKDWRTFCVFTRGFGKPKSLNIINNADDLIDKGQTLKSGRTAIVAKIYLDGQPYIIKRYNKKNWAHQIVRSLMESRSAVSWRNGHLLEFNGVPTAKPLLMLENRWGAFRGRSYVLTEYIAGMHAFDYFNQPGELENKKALAEKVSGLVNHLHQCGYVHGDLKPQNIWVAQDLPILIDLDGMQKVSAADETAFLKDWSRLNKSTKGNVGVIPHIGKHSVKEVASSISIIIPTYNYGARIVAAIESVVNQMNDIDELIIIDDGSTDNTASILETLSAKYHNKLNVFVQENARAAAARNAGINKSSGDYLLFLDADDELDAGALGKYREAVRLGSDAELFLAGHISVEQSGYEKKHLVGFLSNKKADNVMAYWGKKISMCHGAFLVKRKALDTISYPENLRSGEDISVFTHLLASCQTSSIKNTVLRVNKHVDSLRNMGVKDKKSVQSLVESVFNSNFLTASLLDYKQRFYAERMLSLSREKFILGSVAEARSAYWQAVSLEPILLFKWPYLKKYIKSFFGNTFA